MIDNPYRFINLDKANFCGTGRFDAPELQPEHINVHHLEWIPFNYAKTAKNRGAKGVHFYIDDYQFERVWQRPDAYIPMLQEFGAVCQPDFSIYLEMPLSVQIYQHFRKQWLGAYWQMHGIHVIPSLCWCGDQSFDWCLDGVPKQSLVSIASIGTQSDQTEKECFARYCRQAIALLDPSEILWYGICPAEFDWNVIKIRPHYKDIVERRNEHEQKRNRND